MEYLDYIDVDNIDIFVIKSKCIWYNLIPVLTRDYLHCFKRANGLSTERISDMGQFIFKVSQSIPHKNTNTHIYTAINPETLSQNGIPLKCLCEIIGLFVTQSWTSYGT